MTRVMKDSGIEWIGEIPLQWKIVPSLAVFTEVWDKNSKGLITNALKFTYGNIVPKIGFDVSDDYVAETILSYNIVQLNDIMINNLNLNYDFISQRVGRVKEKGVITSAYLALRPNLEKNDAQYLTYLLKAYDFCKAFHNMGIGVRKTLTFKEFRRQNLILPTKKEQERITSFLDSKCQEIDNVLAKTRSSIEEYKKLKQAIITKAVTKGIRKNRKMKDSGIEWIGEIPEEWDTILLKKILTYVKGFAFKQESFTNSGIQVVKVSDIKNGTVYKGNTYVDTQTAESAKEYTLYEDDILMTTVGSGPTVINSAVGQLALVPSNIVGALLNQNAVKLVASSKMSNKYIYMALNQKAYREYLNIIAHGTANQSNITLKDALEFRVPLPNRTEQLEIVEYLKLKCNNINIIISNKERLIAELESYKKSLIYEYVTGKKEVPMA